MKRQSDALEAKLFGAAGAGGRGLWLRQKSVDGQSIVHAEGRDANNEAFAHVQAFNFDPDGAFSQRVNSDRATLRDGYWELEGATIVTPGFDSQTASVYLLATSLTRTEVTRAFVAPEPVSFWGLRRSPNSERAELDGTPYRLDLDDSSPCRFCSSRWFSSLRVFR